jgi:methanogenic corrinoid protein MtbC1
MSQRELAERLKMGQTAISNYESGRRVPSIDVLNLLSSLFNIELNQLVHYKEASEIDFVLLKEKLATYLLGSDDESAFHLINSQRYDEESLVRLYEEVFTKVLYKVGYLWEKGIISVAKEHYVSNIIESMIASNILAKSNLKSNGKKALTMSFSREQHTIGVRMINEYLKILGFKTFFIGNNTPTSSILELIKEHQIDYMMISVTISNQLDQLNAFISEIKNEVNIKVVIGGQAVCENTDCNEYNADGYAVDFNSLKEKIEELESGGLL